MAEETEIVEAPPVRLSLTEPLETITTAQADKIQTEEFERMQKRAAGEDTSTGAIDPNAPPKETTPTKETPPRASDGKFVSPKKEGAVEGEPVKPENEIKPKKTPLAPAPAAPAPTKGVATKLSDAPLFDVKAIMAEVDAEIGKRKYRDSPGTDGTSVEVEGSKLLEEYGQITEPLRNRQDLAIERLAARMEELVRPALASTQDREAEKTQSVIQATIAAVVDAGVPDAAELLADPRMREWAENNPQYAPLLVADPAKADDLVWVFEKFRAAVGIEKPSSETAKPKPAAPARPRSVQAGITSARGGGAREEGGTLIGTPEQIRNAEFERLARRQAESERLAGGI
jgi:hypothetical protein